MLVLSRNINQRLLIGKEIRVTILQINGDRVRIGIEAPTEIPVHREEIYRKIQAQKEGD